MAKKNENIAEETVKKTTKKAKTEGEAVEKTEEEIVDDAIEVLYGDEQKELAAELEKVEEFDIHKKYL